MNRVFSGVLEPNATMTRKKTRISLNFDGPADARAGEPGRK